MQDLFKKYWPYLTGAILFIVLIWAIRHKRLFGVYPWQNAAAAGNSAASLDKKRVLKLGDTGSEVMELQRRMKQDGANEFLGDTGPNGDGVDGDFGPKTEAALFFLTNQKQISLEQYDSRSKAKAATSTPNNWQPPVG